MIILQGLNTCDRCATIYGGKKVKKKKNFTKILKIDSRGFKRNDFPQFVGPTSIMLLFFWLPLVMASLRAASKT